MDGTTLDFTVASTASNTFVTDICLNFLIADDVWLPTSTWVRLLGAVGVVDATARTALYRLARTGFLDRSKQDGQPGYSTSRAWASHMAWASEGAARIDSDQWLLVAFSVPEAERSKRHQLRVVLERLGFAPLGNGTWLGVDAAEAQLVRQLEQADLRRYVDVFLADYRGFDDALALAARCWDVPGHIARLDDFMRDVELQLKVQPTSDKQAFIDLMLASNAWRRLDQRCPQLPTRALPETWNRLIALDLRDEVILSRRPRALQFVHGQAGAG